MRIRPARRRTTTAGFFRGLVRKFRDTLNRIERDRRHHED